MSLFLREKSDGRRTAGYGVYLVAGLAGAALLLLLHRRAGEGAPVRRRAPADVSNVAPITQPAAVMSQVEVAAKQPASDARSYRMAVRADPLRRVQGPDRPPAPDGFNAIDEALSGSAGGGEAPPPYAELPPAFAAPPSRRGRGPESSPAGDSAGTVGPSPGAGLLAYRDPTADQAGAEPGRAAALPSEPGAVFFAPRGTLISVYLLTTVDTGNPAAVIQFAAARSLYFNRRCQLPFGTRFLGRLSGAAMRDRINLAVDTILYPDGLELPVSASAVEADETGANIYPGLEGLYVPPPLWVRAAPYFSDFFTGTMGLLQSRAQQQFAVGIGGLSVQAAGGGDLRTPLYQASAQAAQDFTQARLKEVERRYASHYLVPAGTACWLELEGDLDLAAAHASPRVVRLQAQPRAPNHAEN